MTAVGVFLGVQPRAGGMFQYAQSMLEGLVQLQADGISVKVAYVGKAWKSVLANYPFTHVEMYGGEFGLRLAAGVMATRLPGTLARMVARLANPIVAQMRRMDCRLWIFPAQDSLGYQVPFQVIASIHDLMHRYEGHFLEVSGSGRLGIRDHRFRNLVNWSQLVLVDSNVGRQHVVESYGTDPDKVFPLPYVAPRYITQPEPSDFDQRYALPSKFLFYPAQFWAHKNHQRLVSAAAVARRRCPDIRLVFTGGRRHGYSSLRQHADSLGMNGYIAYPGYVPDAYLSGFYRRARALVMPTFFGPTNIPPLEAFCCGCPAAVSNIYGMAEQSRGAALLFDPRSVDSMVEVLERLWQDDKLCADLRQRGIAHAAHWNQAQFGQALTRLVRDTLRSGPAFGA
jgi:glycosyltransferase involved in cell wall biosynthesis